MSADKAGTSSKGLLGSWIAAFAILVAGCTTTDRAAQIVGIGVEAQEGPELISLIETDLEYYIPEGDGPFPVIIAMHGCGRLHARRTDYAEMANAQGVAYLVVDSFSARGIDYDHAVKRVCSGRDLIGRERAGDVWAATEIVRRDPQLDENRIALMGWSHGGWSVMDFLASDFVKDLPSSLKSAPAHGVADIDAAILYYPYCGAGTLTRRQGWAQSPDATFLLVENDRLTPPGACYETIEKLEAEGVKVVSHFFEGVTHAFDEYELGDSDLKFDPAAAARSDEIFKGFVADFLANAE